MALHEITASLLDEMRTRPSGSSRSSAANLCGRVLDAHKELERLVGFINTAVGFLLRHAAPASVAASKTASARAAARAGAFQSAYNAADAQLLVPHSDDTDWSKAEPRPPSRPSDRPPAVEPGNTLPPSASPAGSAPASAPQA